MWLQSFAQWLTSRPISNPPSSKMFRRASHYCYFCLMQRDTKNQGRPPVLPDGHVAERPTTFLSDLTFWKDLFCRCQLQQKQKRRNIFLHVDDWTNFLRRNFCQYFISLSILYLFICYVFGDVCRAVPYLLNIYSCLWSFIWRKLFLRFRRVLVQLAPVSLWLFYSYILFFYSI